MGQLTPDKDAVAAPVAPEAGGELVVVDYADVHGGADLSDAIQRAYGAGGFGVLAIRGVPGFIEAKRAALSQVHQLAHLPAEQLAVLEDPVSLFNAGWSHGKEKLGDKPDFAKGSFYFNPLVDVPGSAEERAQFPVSYPCNKWPSTAMPALEPACKRIGQVMHGVCVDLARHIDRFAATRVPNYVADLGGAMESTVKAKGRALYYFPLDASAQAEGSADSWIGWHNDSGFLTCLAGDMYVDDETGQEIACPDPRAGLYVVDRNGNDCQVRIPDDCMAIQVGECVQIITGGAVQATPHAVRGAGIIPGSSVKVARISLPCFIDTRPQYPLCAPAGVARETVLDSAVSSKVPALGDRWLADGQTFGSFLQETFRRYYEHTTARKP
jgi:isopenicillin N synthase-like dioxygenase